MFAKDLLCYGCRTFGGALYKQPLLMHICIYLCIHVGLSWRMLIVKHFHIGQSNVKGTFSTLFRRLALKNFVGDESSKHNNNSSFVIQVITLISHKNYLDKYYPGRDRGMFFRYTTETLHHSVQCALRNI